MTLRTVPTILLLAVLGLSGLPAYAQYGATNGEWRSYAADSGSTKYSPLDQINKDNFSQLRIAWRWKTADAFLGMTDPSGGEWFADHRTIIDALISRTPNLYRANNTPNLSNLQATPLMVGGRLYLNTPLSQGVALDAKTGQPLWVFNPKSYEDGTTSMTVTWRQRGVAYWTDGQGDERIFWGTGNGYLICVDAKTGRPCRGFGDNGRVDAMKGLPRAVRAERDYLNALTYSIQSPPVIVGDTVIHGSSISDRRIMRESIPGWVRAWDVRTGAHRWDFHTVPQEGEEGVETWLNDSWKYSGNANVWPWMSGDPELGYVYLPTGTPTNDYYGAHRPGNNLFAESIVAVDVATGKKMWHFQAVHHGLWDYDFPAAPNLVDITVDGRRIKALAQVSKQGFVYTFDRVTGQPVWPIEERPVPTATNLEDEWVSPTQPFPTKPAAFEYQGMTVDDLIDFTPELRQMALEAVKGFTLGPLFTPPNRTIPGQTLGTLFRPTGGGAANWSGAAIDPETGTLYVPSSNNFGVTNYYNPESLGGTLRWTHGPSGLPDDDFEGARPQMRQGLPLVKPPYSRMTAIDMNKGEHVWMTPLGNGDRYRNHPMLRGLNLPPLGGDGRGGPLLTKTLLVSALTAGGSRGGPRLVAYDKATGRELASVDLPAGAIGSPMTYMVDGKQYIAITVGGALPELIAFALP